MELLLVEGPHLTRLILSAPEQQQNGKITCKSVALFFGLFFFFTWKKMPQPTKYPKHIHLQRSIVKKKVYLIYTDRIQHSFIYIFE